MTTSVAAKDMLGVVAAGLLTLGAIVLLWGFGSMPSAYVKERQDYYNWNTYKGSAEQTPGAWSVLQQRLSDRRNCLGDIHVPRRTKLAWMGSTEDEVRRWAVTNERSCLNLIEIELMSMDLQDSPLAHVVREARASLPPI